MYVHRSPSMTSAITGHSSSGVKLYMGNSAYLLSYSLWGVTVLVLGGYLGYLTFKKRRTSSLNQSSDLAQLALCPPDQGSQDLTSDNMAPITGTAKKTHPKQKTNSKTEAPFSPNPAVQPVVATTILPGTSETPSVSSKRQGVDNVKQIKDHLAAAHIQECRNYNQGQFCPKGARCQYTHNYALVHDNPDWLAFSLDCITGSLWNVMLEINDLREEIRSIQPKGQPRSQSPRRSRSKAYSAQISHRARSLSRSRPHTPEVNMPLFPTDAPGQSVGPHQYIPGTWHSARANHI